MRGRLDGAGRRVRARLGRASPRSAAPAPGDHADLEAAILLARQARRVAARAEERSKAVPELRRQVKELQAEVQEARHLNRRLADLIDVVAHVLLPPSGAEDEVRRRLERFAATLRGDPTGSTEESGRG